MNNEQMAERMQQAGKNEALETCIKDIMTNAEAVLNHKAFKPEDKRIIKETFIDDLKNYTPEEIQAAYKQHRNASKQFPAPSDLLQYLEPKETQYNNKYKVPVTPLDSWIYNNYKGYEFMAFSNMVALTLNDQELNTVNNARLNIGREQFRRFSSAELEAASILSISQEERKTLREAEEKIKETLIKTHGHGIVESARVINARSL